MVFSYNGDCSDGELADTTQFSVAVGPINDAPIILSIEDQVIDEDSIGVFALKFQILIQGRF